MENLQTNDKHFAKEKGNTRIDLHVPSATNLGHFKGQEKHNIIGT